MLAEGVPPAMIENVARMAGMPVGPLSLTDEIGIDLAWKIMQATKKDVGTEIVDRAGAGEAARRAWSMKHGRFGRKNAKGFYDYPGARRRRCGPASPSCDAEERRRFDVEELKQRFLVTQALEAARTVEEGVVTDPREADVGSILGFGFAPFTGGTLSYIDGMGAKEFVALADGSRRNMARASARTSCCGRWPRRARVSTAASGSRKSRPPDRKAFGSRERYLQAGWIFGVSAGEDKGLYSCRPG